ncbi:hypothetical protein ACFX10_007108 [Malus domestica]
MYASTKGYYACPVCKENITFDWHKGKICYLRHRRWLSWDHKWHQNETAFFNAIEIKPRPREWFGDEILSQFPDRYASNIGRCANMDGGKFSGLMSYDYHVILQRFLSVRI